MYNEVWVKRSLSYFLKPKVTADGQHSKTIHPVLKQAYKYGLYFSNDRYKNVIAPIT